jgi:hypothetical protein
MFSFFELCLLACFLVGNIVFDFSCNVDVVFLALSFPTLVPRPNIQRKVADVFIDHIFI